jgi:hypothetical protein
MMDDWLTVGATEAEAGRKMDAISEKLESVGHVMQSDKKEVGQRMLFLGIMLDTVRMRMGFDPTQSKGMRAQLQQYRDKIKRGIDLDTGTIRHVAGCLNWYSEVLQSGRLHVRTWWLYLSKRGWLSPVLRSKLIVDTEWWIAILGIWSDSEFTQLEYPILSAAELLEHPNKLLILQSDAAGDDGFGYFWGGLAEEHPRFVSV